MPIVDMKDMLNHAYCHRYAIGAFDLVSMDFLKGILTAAENCRAPIILSLNESHFEHYDFELLMAAAQAAAKRTQVPVAIHLNHASSLESAVRAIRSGCNSVMADFSELAFPENLAHTKEVIGMARTCGVTVEGGLGYVSGLKGGDTEKHPVEISLTLPVEAKAFSERTGVDCLAVSIGTVHGRARNGTKLDYARLAKINEAAGIPLVIHGGTGLTDEQFMKLIANGVAKINYYTALSVAAGNAILQSAHDGETAYTALCSGAVEAVRTEVERCIRMWGSGGRAAEVLAQCRPWREVEHIVLYNVDSRLNESEKTALVTQGMDTLAAIPGVKSVTHCKAVQGDARYRQCWLIRFASEAVIAGYRDHPDHVRYANKTFRPAASDRLTIDLMVGAHD